MSKVVEDVKDVIVYPSATDKTKNRGFAFVEFESHRAAAMARRKLIPGRIQLWGHQIAVDWAEPEQDVDEDIMAKVKILYVRNLMLTTTEEALESVFNQASGKENSVERVKKIRDYAFVHFRDRDSALTARNVLNGQSLEGSSIEVVLAKPVDKQEYQRYTRSEPLKGIPGMPGMPGMAGMAGMTGIPGVSAFPYNLAAAQSVGADPTLQYAYLQSQLAAAAAIRPGIQTKPMMAAGRGPIMRGRGRGAAGSRAAGGTGRGAVVPGYMRNQIKKPPQETLDDLCAKNGWGSPIYQLHSTMSREAGNDVQLFLYKVSLPTLASQFPNPGFQPNKLCRTLEEAKNYAAEYVLLQLGYPMETGAYAAADGSHFAAGQLAGSPTMLQQSMDASAAAALYQGRPIAAQASPYSIAPSSHTPTMLSPADLASSAAANGYLMGMPGTIPMVATAARQSQLAQQTLIAPQLSYQSAPWFPMG